MSAPTNIPKQMVFPPDVLARIAPDISLQRHLSVGLRPSLRGFTEFRPLEIAEGGLNDVGKSNVIGSAVVKSGDTRVICGITLGVLEENSVDTLLAGDTHASQDASLDNYASVYPVVDIARGRSGAPTDEEMILSQKLYETVLHNRIIATDALRVLVGTKINGEVHYPGSGSIDKDLEDLITPKKRWSYTLYAHIKVFSRSGPLFDLCYAALLGALRNCEIPTAYIDDKSTDIKIPVRSRGNFGHLRESYSLILDPDTSRAGKLALTADRVGTSSSFGLIDREETSTAPEPETMDVDGERAGDTVLLADLEGEAEESCAESKINIICSKSSDRPLNHVSIIGGGSRITKALLQESIRIARVRSDIS